MKNYLEMLRNIAPEREALILGEKIYTYQALAELAEEKARKFYAERGKSGSRQLCVIRCPGILNQLTGFLACSITGDVPLIVPADAEIPENFCRQKLPENACMAVMTSGTGGERKLLFRTFESWYHYFPVQNQIFGVHAGSRMFMQGSLAFTGNLNFYLSLLSVGAAIIGEDSFDPRSWMKRMEDFHANMIYLIPAKLRILGQICERKKLENTRIYRILSGSQSFGGQEAGRFLQNFPFAEMILYYGASELSYVSYVRSSDMNEDKTLIGQPFPGVQAKIRDGKIFVTTDYGAIGFGKDSFIGDYGHQDENGLLYFDGRRDDLYNINGIKISAIRVENALTDACGAAEAAVRIAEKDGRDYLAAWVVMKSGQQADEGQMRDNLKAILSPAEIPRRIYFVSEMPKNESGKIMKGQLASMCY